MDSFLFCKNKKQKQNLGIYILIKIVFRHIINEKDFITKKTI